MAVDKEALICLSRVYSYYFKCNFPLFYVYPALTRYLSILFLNILTLLACTQSSDNLFHTLMVLCENENFLTSNLLCFFTRVTLFPLVILLSLIAVICVTKSRTGDYDFRACARARGFRGSTFSVGRIRFAVCAERSRDKTCVF